MLAKPAALLFLVAKTLRDREPFQRLLEFAIVRRHDARKRRRELRAHRDFAFAFIGEIEELPDDLGTALFRVKLRRSQDRSVPFHKTVTARDLAPFAEDVIPPRAISRQEITETRERLHQKMRPRARQITKRECGCG